jgi:hypothetical protein
VLLLTCVINMLFFILSQAPFIHCSSDHFTEACCH